MPWHSYIAGWHVPAQDLTIRDARTGEGERLREIAVASKSHWGYDPEWVRAWVADGDFGDERLAADGVYVADVEGRLVAWAALAPRSAEVAWLEDLWVEPQWMRRGIGTRLFAHVAERGRALGAARLEWEAEPNSVGFYEKVGAHLTGRTNTSSWERDIPVMELRL